MLKGGVPKKEVEKKMKEDGENPAVGVIVLFQW